MAARPLIQHGIAGLEAMFSEMPADTKVLKSLRNELRHRQVPKALALLQKVEKALSPSEVAAPEVSTIISDETSSAMSPERARLTELLKRHRRIPADKQHEHLADDDVSTSPIPASLALDVHVSSTPSTSAPTAKDHAFIQTSESKTWRTTADTLGMSISEAYHRLQATPGTSWESIEEMRRQIVQQSHPANLAKAGDKKKLELINEAKKANLAYMLIHEARIPTMR